MPFFATELHIQRYFVSTDDKATVYDWLCQKLLIHENAHKLREMSVEENHHAFIPAQPPPVIPQISAQLGMANRSRNSSIALTQLQVLRFA